ncbi:hypothetical protein [Halopiger thermotolerans]
MTDAQPDVLFYLLLVFVMVGAGFGWTLFFLQPVPIIVTCHEDPDYMNYSQYGNHNVVQLNTYTPRWRTWTGWLTVDGPTQINDHNETGKKMVMPNIPFDVGEAAAIYGSPRFTRHYDCSRTYLRG